MPAFSGVDAPAAPPTDAELQRLDLQARQLSELLRERFEDSECAAKPRSTSN